MTPTLIKNGKPLCLCEDCLIEADRGSGWHLILETPADQDTYKGQVWSASEDGTLRLKQLENRPGDDDHSLIAQAPVDPEWWMFRSGLEHSIAERFPDIPPPQVHDHAAPWPILPGDRLTSTLDQDSDPVWVVCSCGDLKHLSQLSAKEIRALDEAKVARLDWMWNYETHIDDLLEAADRRGWEHRWIVTRYEIEVTFDRC